MIVRTSGYGIGVLGAMKIGSRPPESGKTAPRGTSVGVWVGVGLRVGVGEGPLVLVGLGDCVAVAVAEGVGDRVGVGVRVRVAVRVMVFDPPALLEALMSAIRAETLAAE